MEGCPISVESPARRLQEMREETKNLEFAVGDKVHVIFRGKIKNGIIKRYDSKLRRPYEVFFFTGDINYFSKDKLYLGNINPSKRSKPVMVIQYCDPPYMMRFD